MIKTFRCKHGEKVFLRELEPQFSHDIQRKILRKLLLLDAAERLDDWRAPPGNRLERLAPIHPGEILFEEFLQPLNISQYKLAKDISVPPRRINEIVHGKRSISADKALRLSRYFSLSERFWLNLQSRYDLEVEKDKLKDRIEKEVKILERKTA